MTDKSMLSAAKKALQEKRAAAEAMSADWKVDEKGNFELSTKQYQDYTGAVKGAQEAKSFIDSVEQMDQIAAYLDEPVGQSEAAMNVGADRGDMEGKTLADVFIDSPEYKAAKGEGREGWHKNITRIQGSMEGKSLHSLSGGTVAHTALGQVENIGLRERQMRKTRIRDLFPKSTTKANLLYGVVETGWVNNARQVRQRYKADGVTPLDPNYGDVLGQDPSVDSDVFGLKPESKLTLKPIVWPIATIAHTLDAHKNLLDDEPRLRSFINRRMVEGVKYAEDYDLLHSVGDNSEAMTGLFNVPGTQRYTALATDKKSVQIRRAITKAQLAEYDPNSLITSPEMWEDIEVEEDGQGGFRVSTNVAIGATKQVWHLNVVATTAMPDTEFIVANFGMAVELHDREAVNVVASTEHKDNFARNVITFRAEERLGLEISRPESIVIGTWDNTL